MRFALNAYSVFPSDKNSTCICS